MQPVLWCELSMKVFGNELSAVNCRAMRNHVKHRSLNLAKLAAELLKVPQAWPLLALLTPWHFL